MNVPNFGPGTGPGVLRSWAQTVEGLGDPHETYRPQAAWQMFATLSACRDQDTRHARTEQR